MTQQIAGQVVVVIPLRTVSAANAREHRMAKARRVKQERYAVGMTLNPKPRPALPVRIVLTRRGPNTTPLDGDNLQSAMKAVRDEVARWLGVDDGSKLLKFHYRQERTKEWGVVIDCATVEV